MAKEFFNTFGFFFRLFVQKVRTFKKIRFGVVHRRKVTSSSAAVSHQVGCKI
jgi:hypothetical protein